MLTRWNRQSDNQTIRQSDGSKTETTLSSVDTRGSWPIVNKRCLVQQMTEKIAVEFDAKKIFGKKYKNLQVFLFN